MMDHPKIMAVKATNDPPQKLVDTVLVLCNHTEFQMRHSYHRETEG